MKLNLYMTKDVLEGQFKLILTAPNDALLRRQTKQFLSIPKSPLAVNIDDTQIFCLGSLDTESGILTSHGPDFVCNLSEIQHELEEDLRKMSDKEGEKHE